jgi:hypothetical protein
LMMGGSSREVARHAHRHVIPIWYRCGRPENAPKRSLHVLKYSYYALQEEMPALARSLRLGNEIQ